MFFPKNIDFFQLFDNQASEIQKAFKLFAAIEEHDDIKKRAVKIKELEHSADEITHEILKTLNQTFITPIDREDIAKLAGDMDDIIDVLDMAVNRLSIYKIDPLPKEIFLYARLAEKAMAEIGKAIKEMRNKKTKDQVLKHCEIVNFIENEVDELHRRTLEKLFDTEKDAIMILKLREIYEALEHMTDRCEDVANSLEAIIVKNG